MKRESHIKPKHIKIILRVFDLKQKQLAHVLGMTPATVCRWMKGDYGPEGAAHEVINALYQAARYLEQPGHKKKLERAKMLLSLGLGATILIGISELSEKEVEK